MITDFDTNKIYFSDLLKSEKRYEKVYTRLKKIFDDVGFKMNFLPATKDVWARDYMPIQVNDNKFVEFRYDPDYLSNARHIKTYPDIVCNAIGLHTIKSDIILDGGNVVKSKNKVILTNKIFVENRFVYGKEKLIGSLKDLLEVDEIIIIPWDKKEKFGHADGILRFIDENKVLVSDIYKHDKIITDILNKHDLDPKFFEFNGNKSSTRRWIYINYLQTEDMILVPQVGIDEDKNAIKKLKSTFKNRIIKAVNIEEIARRGGGLNCITWTTKEIR